MLVVSSLLCVSKSGSSVREGFSGRLQPVGELHLDVKAAYHFCLKTARRVLYSLLES